MRKALPPLAFFLAVNLLFKHGFLLLNELALPPEFPSAVWVNTFACGICFLLAIYSLSLFLQKRSERYLLWLFVIAFLAFWRTLIASELTQAILAAQNMGWLRIPLDIFTVVICFALCFWLTQTSLPGRWNLLLSPLGLLSLFLFLLCMRLLIPGTLLQIILGNMPYFAGLTCLMLACIRKAPCAYILLFGMAARTACAAT